MIIALKKEEFENNRHSQYLIFCENIKNKLNDLVEKYLNENYKTIEELKELKKDTQLLNQLMLVYIKVQLKYLTEPMELEYEGEKYLSYGDILENFGIPADFHEIKNPLTGICKYPIDCCCGYIRSKSFEDEVKKRNIVNVKIPQVILEYIVNK